MTCLTTVFSTPASAAADSWLSKEAVSAHSPKNSQLTLTIPQNAPGCPLRTSQTPPVNGSRLLRLVAPKRVRFPRRTHQETSAATSHLLRMLYQSSLRWWERSPPAVAEATVDRPGLGLYVLHLVSIVVGGISACGQFFQSCRAVRIVRVL